MEWSEWLFVTCSSHNPAPYQQSCKKLTRCNSFIKPPKSFCGAQNTKIFSFCALICLQVKNSSTEFVFISWFPLFHKASLKSNERTLFLCVFYFGIIFRIIDQTKMCCWTIHESLCDIVLVHLACKCKFHEKISNFFFWFQFCFKDFCLEESKSWPPQIAASWAQNTKSKIRLKADGKLKLK